MLIDKRRLAGISAALLVASGAVALTSGTASAADCGYLFDDFHYGSPTDAALTTHGWTARSYSGGPGVPGARLVADNITFPTVDGEKAAQLTASTDGTAAAPCRPSSPGPAAVLGRHLREPDQVPPTPRPAAPTATTSTRPTSPSGPPSGTTYDPLYSELDFSEYLPNGGWGVTGRSLPDQLVRLPERPLGRRTTRTRAERQLRRLAQPGDPGRRTATSKYYIDGVLRPTTDAQGNPVLPAPADDINYNLWFIDTAGHTERHLSTYAEQVDWVLFAKNQVLSPAQATAQAASYRTAGNAFTDSVSSTGSCTTSPPLAAHYPANHAAHHCPDDARPRPTAPMPRSGTFRRSIPAARCQAREEQVRRPERAAVRSGQAPVEGEVLDAGLGTGLDRPVAGPGPLLTANT